MTKRCVTWGCHVVIATPPLSGVAFGPCGRTAAKIAFESPFVHSWEVVKGRATSFTECYDTVRMNAALGLPAAIDIVSRPDVPGHVDLTERAQPRVT